MGWLDATPKTWKETNREFRERRKWPLGLVDKLPGQYLIDLMFDMGPFDNQTGGPVSWERIWAFTQATGAAQEAWERRALSRVTREYVFGHREGADPLSIPPVDRKPIK